MFLSKGQIYRNILPVFLLSVIFLNTPVQAQPNWTILESSRTVGTLKDVFFLDPNNGWAVGNNDNTDMATILFTGNGGTTWQNQTHPLSGILNTIILLDANTGYSAGQDWNDFTPAVLKTGNGGQNWEKQTVPNLEGELYDLHLLSAIKGFAVGYNSGNDKTLILRTTNGTSWTNVIHPSVKGQLNSVHFSDAQNGWIAGYNSNLDSPILLQTIDGGST